MDPELVDTIYAMKNGIIVIVFCWFLYWAREGIRDIWK